MKTIYKLFICYAIFLYSGIHINSQEVSTFLGPDELINDGITFDEEGNLYGSDHAGYGVYKYTTDEELETLAIFNDHPNGIVLDGENNLYVAIPQGNKICRIDVSGNVTQYGPAIPNPNGLIFEFDSDTLIVTSYTNNTLSKLAPDGGFINWINDAELNGPLGLCYDDEHILYVSNFNDGKVFKVQENELEYFATVPGDFLGGSYFSTGYILWMNDYIYATGYAKNIVYRIDASGNVEAYAGSGIFGYLDGEAQIARFMHPNGIAKKQDSDDIYISGYESHAVRIISENIQNSESPSSARFYVNCYPNPVTDILHFDHPANMRVDYVEIFNLEGRKVKVIPTVSDQRINLSGLPTGSYLIAIQINGRRVSRSVIKL